MKKINYLKDGDRVFCTGCFLIYDKIHNQFLFDGAEDSIYIDGLEVIFKNNKPCIDE